MLLKVNPHKIEIDKSPVNEREINISKCTFEFAEEITSDYVKEAYFTFEGETYKQIIVNDECDFPSEVLTEKGQVKIGVVAYLVEGETEIKRYNPSPAYFNTWDGSLVDNAENSEPITPSDKEQIEQAITNLQNDVDDLDETKQDKLVSGENIKTINSESLLGSGNIDLNDTYYTESEIDDLLSVKADKSEIPTKTSDLTNDSGYITNEVNDLINYTLKTQTGSQIALNINSSNYQMTAILKDKNGNVIYTSNVIDLPIESMIINVTYDSSTKEIVFTLQNGNVLRVSVADLVSGLVSTDELNTILANYYTKTEIDTLLSAKANSNDVYTKSEADTLLGGKVDTTAYMQGQATQDANIEENASNIDWLQTLVSQMPTVPGIGTDISLQDVLNYRFMKFVMKGNSSQDGEPTPDISIPVKVVTGENSLIISNENLFSSTWQQGTISSTTGENQSASNEIRTKDFILVTPNQNYAIKRSLTTSAIKMRCYDINKDYLGSGTNYVNLIEGITPTNPMGAGDSSCVISFKDEVRYFKMCDGSNNLATEYSMAKGDIPLSEYIAHQSQTYPLSLGNIELCSTPYETIRDYIYGSPNNWFKKQVIGKVVLDGSEAWYDDNDNAPYRTNISGAVITTSNNLPPQIWINNFQKTSYNSTWSLFDSVVTASEKANPTRLKFRYTAVNNLEEFKTWLSTHNSTVYYLLATPTDVQITDTTLIPQLNNIYNNAHSYNGTTNVTSTYASGNEQMIIEAGALKNVWLEAESL